MIAFTQQLSQFQKMNTRSIAFLLLFMVACQCTLFDKFAQFKSYAKEYNKKYESKVHELYRFYLYLQNLEYIEKLNLEEEGTAVYGETQFTDMSKSEMKDFLGVRVEPGFKFNYVQNYTNDDSYKLRTDVPDIWNWQQQGAVGPIKNQGSCGSCWTYSTVGNIESLNYLKTKRYTDFSEQQLIDCDKSNFGCGGGWPYQAINWLATHDGLMTEKDYPMRTNYSGPCQFSTSSEKIQIKGYMNITHDEKIIKNALYDNGPLSILLDFTGMMHYKSGIASPRLCSTWPDHALVLVGYGTKDGDYWLIKNSWGPQWGINGYLMLERGKSKCGINLWATTAVLK